MAGGLFGTKVVLNEFVAFIDLGAQARATLSPRTVAIVTFALCGFANFSSIAIQMAVTGGLAPNQRPMIAKLGPQGAARRLALQPDERGAGRADPDRDRGRRRRRPPRRRRLSSGAAAAPPIGGAGASVAAIGLGG